MKISVVIPVYNAERYLRTTLDSVAAAARRLVAHDPAAEVEVICVDDGSTDGSAAILDAYAPDAHPSTHHRLIVLRQPNAGVSAARNRGMDAAAGELVTFLDADDTFHQQALEVIWDVFRKTQADVIRYGVQIVSDHAADSKTPLADCPATPLDIRAATESPIRKCALGWATVLVRRLVGEVRWPSLTQCEDPLFVLACLSRATRAVVVDAPLVNYLIRPDSAARQVSLAIIHATCLYLPMAYDACARLPCHAATRADTCRFIAGFLDGPLKGCWKKLPRADRAAARRAVLRARWAMALRDPLFRPPKERLAYDVAFGIGSACTCTEQLRKAGLQYEAFPLDWVGRLDVRERAAVARDGFVRMLSSPEALVAAGAVPDDGRHWHLIDQKTKFAFYHDFPVGRSVAASFASVSEKYARRAARFRQRLSAAHRVLIVWIGETRDQTHVSDAEVRDCLATFSAAFPQATFEMLLLEQRADVPRAQVVCTHGKDFERYAFDYLSHEPGAPRWQLCDELVQPFLRRYSVRDTRPAPDRREARQRVRAAELKRFGARGVLDLLVAKAEYRLFRHLQKALMRKGVRLG